MHSLWKTCEHFNAKVGVASKRGAMQTAHIASDCIAKSEGNEFTNRKQMDLFEDEIANMHSRMLATMPHSCVTKRKDDKSGIAAQAFTHGAK
jgi:hypothetical protein